MKNKVIAFILIIAFVSAFGWAQVKIKNYRVGIRVEEKILMLSDRPQVTKILSLGFDGAVANLLWIRAIQYFGGNFSSLDEPQKKEGLINLFENMFALDPHFVEAYKFAGFVTNEAVKDPNLAIDFLMQGAANNPDAWRLPFEAGFIAFYQMEEYEVAKDFFIQAAFGMPFYAQSVENYAGISEQDQPQNLIDGDISTEVAFLPDEGSVTLDLGETRTIGRLTLKQNTYRNASFETHYAAEPGASYQEIPSVTTTNFHLINPAIEARLMRFDQFQPAPERDSVLIADIVFHGQRHPEAPGYVDRMAIEMDRKSGRFSAAWNQYLRYYQEAQNQGDQTSAQLALEKLRAIYNEKAREILTDAIELYRAENDELPSTQMDELVSQRYIERMIQQRINEDPNFYEEVYPVMFPQNNPRSILTAFDGQTPVYLMTFETDQGETDWYIATRRELVNQQEAMIKELQQYVDKFKQEEGRLPNGLSELKEQDWFTEDDTIFEDPLRGFFVLNEETGQVEARNPAL